MGLIGCPEASVTIYQSTLRNPLRAKISFTAEAEAWNHTYWLAVQQKAC